MNWRLRGKIPLTENDVLALRAERDRTGVGPAALLRGQSKAKPDDLSAGMIVGWLLGKTETVKATHLKFALSLWASLPDAPKRIEVTEEMRSELANLIEQTGLGASAIVTAMEVVPDGLFPGTIQQWISGKVKTARADHWDSVVERLRSAKGG